MRKTFLIAAVIALIVAPFVSTASAQTLQTQDAGQKLDPVRVAPVLGWENGRPIIGEWTPYKKQDGIGDPFPPAVILDSYEGDTHYGNADVCDVDQTQNFPANGSLSGGVDPACDFGGGLTGACGDGDTSRWWFGPGEVWGGAIGAMASFADGAPSVSTAFSFTWGQSFGTGAPTPCVPYVTTYVIIDVYDNSVASLIDGTTEIDATTLGDGFVDGIVLDFGALAPGAGYYFAGPDLTNEDPELHLGVVDGATVGLPSDGALEILFWDDDGLGNPIPGSHSQPMLWAPKDAASQGAWVEGLYYLDGFSDFAGSGTYDCTAYDGDYLIATNDDFLASDASTVGCPEILMPMVGLFGAEGAPAIEICPDTSTVTAGSTNSGSSADICDEDSAIWTLQSTTFAAAFSPAPIAITFDGTTNPLGGGTDVTLRLVGGPDFGNDAAFIQLRMFNFTTQAYVGMPFISQPNSDNTVYEFTNPVADFVGPNGELQAEITCAKTVPGPVRLRMDQVQWVVQ